jgi:hypothetical protein
MRLRGYFSGFIFLYVFSLSLFCVKVISEVIIGLRVVFAECRRKNKKDEKERPLRKWASDFLTALSRQRRHGLHAFWQKKVRNLGKMLTPLAIS